MSHISELQKLYNMFSDLNIDKIDIKNKEGSFTLSFGTEKKKCDSKYGDQLPIQIIEPNIRSISDQSQYQECIIDIKSPAVGFFDRANPRTKDYYIKLRDTVKKHQILGHVIVLGVSHDVITPTSGKIIEILVENDQPIEYGQPIMRLEIINE